MQLSTDTTLLQPLMCMCHRLDPTSDFVAFRPRMTERSVELRGSLAPLLGCAAALRGVVEAWALDEDCVVRLRGTGPWEANMLRRALLTRVTTCAFHEVRIFENGTDTPNEVVAHRLGQLALRCEASVVTGRLDVTSEEECIRASSLACEGGAVSPQDLSAILAKAGRLHLSCTSSSGRGASHAKYSAVASPAVVPLWPLRGLEAAPPEALEALRLDTMGRSALDRSILEEVLAKKGLEATIGEPEDFDVHVESLGQHSEASCLQRAQRALLEELDDLVARVSGAAVAEGTSAAAAARPSPASS